MEKDYIVISIPTDLYKRIEEKIAGTETTSVEEYVIKLLGEKFPQAAEEDKGLSQDEEEKIKERLKALGYMD